MKKLYYTPPTDEQFEEVKQRSIQLWATKNTGGGYSQNKIDSIKDMHNIEDNVMSIIAQFDIFNMALLASMLTDDTRKIISDRMIDGGSPDEANPFLK